MAMHSTLERVSKSHDRRTSSTGTPPSLPSTTVEGSAPFIHLSALCDAFEARLEARLPQSAGDGTSGARRGEVKEQLQQICAAARGTFGAATTPAESVSARATSVSWPPKERTLSAIKQFTQTPTLGTDLFKEGHLLSACQQSYSHGHPESSRYVPLFNVLVLLALGQEMAMKHHDTAIGDWTLSVLPSRIAMLSIADLITTPELVNVQALSLLVSPANYASTVEPC